MIILTLFLFKKINYYKFFNTKDYYNNKKFIYLIFFLFIYLLLWFVKFPVYRFGQSIIASFIIILYAFLFIKKNSFNYKKILSFVLIFGFLSFYTKNIFRIINRLDLNYFNAPWPALYSMNESENEIKKFKKIYDKNKNFLYYYSGGTECMYTSSPCSNYLNKDIKKITKFGYQVFFYEKI